MWNSALPVGEIAAGMAATVGPSTQGLTCCWQTATSRGRSPATGMHTDERTEWDMAAKRTSRAPMAAPPTLPASLPSGGTLPPRIAFDHGCYVEIGTVGRAGLGITETSFTVESWVRVDSHQYRCIVGG